MARLPNEYTYIKMANGLSFFIDLDLEEVRESIESQNTLLVSLDIFNGLETKPILLNPNQIIYMGLSTLQAGGLSYCTSVQ